MNNVNFKYKDNKYFNVNDYFSYVYHSKIFSCKLELYNGNYYSLDNKGVKMTSVMSNNIKKLKNK